MNPAPEYSYEPLPSQQDGLPVRFLVLQPGAFSSPIYIRVELAHLDNGPETVPYEALSYRWGASDDPEEILVSSSGSNSNAAHGRLCVTQNLFQALRHSRLEDRSRTLWIDAVSINQNSLEEKNREVARMHEIYQGNYT